MGEANGGLQKLCSEQTLICYSHLHVIAAEYYWENIIAKLRATADTYSLQYHYSQFTFSIWE